MKQVIYEDETKAVQLEKLEEEQCLRIIEEALDEQVSAIDGLSEPMSEAVKDAICEVLDTYGCGIIANTDDLHLKK